MMRNSKSGLNVFWIALIFVFAAACDSSTSRMNDEQITRDIDVIYHEALTEDSEKFVAKLAIEGMSCEVMCASKVASTLQKLDGVKKVDVEFVDADEESYAFVEYDSDVITEKDMVAGVHGIANGIYQVTSINITHYKLTDVTVQKRETSIISYKPEVGYKLPNIFSALVKLF